ncbi:MAG: hypothetical protein R6U38_07640 [Desulfatiglandaceae bacterium]
MNMPYSNHWISSKQILARTGISRATLNNYIKNGILPAPVVRTPQPPSGGTRRIGYFPCEVLKRIEAVQALKRQGKSMAEISKQFKGTPINKHNGAPEFLPGSTGRQDRIPSWFAESKNGVSPKLTIEGMFMPAYLLDHDFKVVWINRYAERDIFHQQTNLIERDEYPSVFRILFDWRFHERVKNWRDLIALHTGFVKMKYSRNWFDKLSKGLTKSEVFLLKEIYDRVTPFAEEPVRKTDFQFLTGDTISEAYGIFTLFCIEGLFFLYIPLTHI